MERLGDFEQIRLDQREHVIELVLDRPEVRNAMSEEMGREMVAAVELINAHREVRVVLIRGEGKSFAAGGDFEFIKARHEGESEDNRRVMLGYYQRFLSVRELRAPTIAALHGAAIGAGLCMALACDIRVAAAKTRLGLNFVRLGIHPGMGATYFLPRLVGPSRANDLLLTGRLFSAEEGLSWGLLSALYPEVDFLEEARSLAAQIASVAPMAAARTKTTLQQSLHRTLEQSLMAEALGQVLDFPTHDMQEGLTAARERRDPVFRGR